MEFPELLLHCGVRNDGASSYLGLPGAPVESVDLPDVRVREALPLAYLTLGGVLRDYRLLAPGLSRRGYYV